jgi:hypothetical protein
LQDGTHHHLGAGIEFPCGDKFAYVNDNPRPQPIRLNQTLHEFDLIEALLEEEDREQNLRSPASLFVAGGATRCGSALAGLSALAGWLARQARADPPLARYYDRTLRLIGKVDILR